MSLLIDDVPAPRHHARNGKVTTSGARHRAWKDHRTPIGRELFAAKWRLGVLHAIEMRKATARGDETTIAALVLECCHHYKVSRLELLSPRRWKRLVRLRQYICWRARHGTSRSFPEIARALGNRDHTTIMHGIRRFQAALDAGEQWAVDLAGGRR